MIQPISSIRLPRALKALLGSAFQDAVQYEVRIEGFGEDTYVRVYKPAEPGEVVGLKAQLEASIAEEPKPKLAGGELAQRAGILCNEGAFRVFIKAIDKNDAASILRTRCGIQSRAELDHNPEAAAKFRELSHDYYAWLQDRR